MRNTTLIYITLTCFAAWLSLMLFTSKYWFHWYLMYYMYWYALLLRYLYFSQFFEDGILKLDSDEMTFTENYSIICRTVGIDLDEKDMCLRNIKYVVSCLEKLQARFKGCSLDIRIWHKEWIYQPLLGDFGYDVLLFPPLHAGNEEFIYLHLFVFVYLLLAWIISTTLKVWRL